jgi:hypothetical protein
MLQINSEIINVDINTSRGTGMDKNQKIFPCTFSTAVTPPSSVCPSLLRTALPTTTYV